MAPRRGRPRVTKQPNNQTPIAALVTFFMTAPLAEIGQAMNYLTEIVRTRQAGADRVMPPGAALRPPRLQREASGVGLTPTAPGVSSMPALSSDLRLVPAGPSSPVEGGGIGAPVKERRKPGPKPRVRPATDGAGVAEAAAGAAGQLAGTTATPAGPRRRRPAVVGQGGVQPAEAATQGLSAPGTLPTGGTVVSEPPELPDQAVDPTAE